MSRAKYKVYDPETDTLKFINDSESNLLAQLNEADEVRFERMLREYIGSVESKMECLNRLDEITTFLSNHIRAFDSERRMVYFLDRPKALKKIIVFLEELRIKYSKKDGGISTNDVVSDRKIFIEDELIPEISKELAPFFLNPNNLEKVLSGTNEPLEKLVFKKDSKMLVGTFTTLKNCQIVKNPVSEIVSWLVARFQSTLKGKATDLEPASVKSYLAKNENPSANRIINIETLAKKWSRGSTNRR
jgi:hypothetical protein